MYEYAAREQADLNWLQRYMAVQRLTEEREQAEQQQWQEGDQKQEVKQEEGEMQVEQSPPQTTATERLSESHAFCDQFFPGQFASARPCRVEREHETPTPQLKSERQRLAEQLRPRLADLARRHREQFHVRSDTSPVVLEFRFANFVTVAYVGNALTGEDYCFNLHALSRDLLPYYPEYRKKKFAKVNLRLRDGGSHMIYGSGIIVESGSDCTRTSKQMLRHTMWLLAHVCGYKQLVVQRRACFNIVATGNVCRPDPRNPGQLITQPLCLGVLKQLFPAASYKKDKFSGVIIKLVDVERYFAEQAYHSGQRDAGAEYEYNTQYDGDDDDTEALAQINAECEHERSVRVKREGEEAERQRNDTLEEEFAQ